MMGKPKEEAKDAGRVCGDNGGMKSLGYEARRPDTMKFVCPEHGVVPFAVERASGKLICPRPFCNAEVQLARRVCHASPAEVQPAGHPGLDQAGGDLTTLPLCTTLHPHTSKMEGKGRR